MSLEQEFSEAIREMPSYIAETMIVIITLFVVYFEVNLIISMLGASIPIIMLVSIMAFCLTLFLFTLLIAFLRYVKKRR